MLATSFSERHSTPEFFLSQAAGGPGRMSIDEIRQLHVLTTVNE
jgi:hypothetical protein